MKNSLLVFVILCGLGLSAQTKVSGVIKDASGDPVAFANVLFKDSQEGTISDENGRFYLESPKTHTFLIFSFVGYTTMEVGLEQRTTYNMEIILEEGASALDEVVLYTGKT